MAFVAQKLPDSVLASLAQQGVQPDRILLSLSTDIDRLGRYQPQWLVVLEDRLFVAHEGPPVEIAFTLAFAEAAEFRIQSAVGSGLLQARVDSMYVDVLRFTNRLSDIFQKVARKLDRHLRGEPIAIHEDEVRDDRRCPSCGLRLEFAGDSCPRCVNRGAVLVRMWRLMAAYRGMAFTMMGLLLLGVGLDLVAPMLTRRLVDTVLPGSQNATTGAVVHDPAMWSTSLHLLLNIVIILALVHVGRMIVNICNGILGSRVGTSITADMRGRLVEHLQKLSVGYYDRQQIGSLVGRVAYDTEALHSFIGQITSGFLFQLAMVFGAGIMMFTLNPTLALCTLIPAPIVILGSTFFWRYVYPRHYRFWDASSKQAGMLSGTLSGIRVVKAFNQEARETERFNKASRRLQTSRRAVDYASSVFNPIMGLIFQFGGWIVWYVGGRSVLQDQMTLGSLMAFFGYMWMFYIPLGTLSQFTNWLTQFVTQAHRIFEILDTPSEIRDQANPTPMPQIKGRIEFEGVTFGYIRSMPVLQDLNLVIEPGEMIGIVGRSGSGKSTIINLICRFYDVSEGRVTIDGLDVREVSRPDLLRGIGVVLQEPFLFRGSIWQNVTYGKPNATPEELITAARAANAHNFILRQAHAYDTWVGERGAGLSGGERQRIGIARVLLTDPRILILDEATSSVDAESEASIQGALAELVKGRTTIAIAHRLSTLRNAQRIIVVDQGKIIESGPHEELMKIEDGHYARLVKIQGQKMAEKQTVDVLNQELELRAGKDVRLTDDGPLPDPRSHRPRWLQPDLAKIHLGNLGALHVTVPNEMIYGGVFAVRCMPVYYPERYISLRYRDHEKREVEVGLIRDLADWPEETRTLVRESLLKRYFVHTIVGIEEIKPYGSYLGFRVQTDLGPMEFMMRWQGDRAHDYGQGGKMLLDTDDNRYLVPDVSALAESERRLFMRYIYW